MCNIEHQKLQINAGAVTLSKKWQSFVNQNCLLFYAIFCNLPFYFINPKNL